MLENEILLSGTVPDEAIIDTFGPLTNGWTVHSDVQAWIDRLSRKDSLAREKLGLGPGNSFANNIALYIIRFRATMVTCYAALEGLCNDM